MKPIQILEQQSEIGAGTRGSSLGIDALKVSSLNLKSDFFARYPSQKIPDQNHLLYQVNGTPSANYIDGMVKVYEAHYKKVEETLRNGKFPLVLSADHASAGATIAGIKAHYRDQKLGVIWVDAHGDLHSPFTSPTGNLHGMPLATALNEDNLEFKGKKVKPETQESWDKLKNMGGFAPKIFADDLIFFGVRDTETPEDELIKKKGITNYKVDECRNKGIEVVVKEALTQLEDCPIIYLSFDVDSMDCNVVSLGTGTPVPDGFLPEEAQRILELVIESGKLVCMEMVEVNPTLDNKQNMMADTAFKILEHSVEKIEKTL